MLNAGDLDRRIALQRNAPTTNALNEAVDAWSDVATVWAAREDLSDGERSRAAQTAATITTRFRIRWSSTVAGCDPTWRLRYPADPATGRLYDIIAVKEIGRREGLEISATARSETPS